MAIHHPGFHAQDGWYFDRQDDGSVKISAAVQRCSEQIVLDADTWASIIASMSAAGENSARYEQARRFHAGSES